MGRRDGGNSDGKTPTEPTVVAEFLEQLDPQDHHRVLEIGMHPPWPERRPSRVSVSCLSGLIRECYPGTGSPSGSG
jgi:hypothetical protein